VRRLSQGICAAVVIVAAAMAAPACEPPPASGPHAAIARLHRAHCGACHRRVDPGTRTRAQLEGALPRHHNRVHMTDAEWSEMLEYLAADGSAQSDAGAD
jgi:hypothetical protein